VIVFIVSKMNDLIIMKDHEEKRTQFTEMVERKGFRKAEPNALTEAIKYTVRLIYMSLSSLYLPPSHLPRVS